MAAQPQFHSQPPFMSPAEIAAVRAPLEHATFMPPRLYSDPAVFEFERTRMFRRTWLPLCHLSQLPESGDYLARVLCGEPVVATRDRDGVLHVLSNVCRHRNALVAQGSGKCRGHRLSCPYHGWTYGLDGRLIAAPQMEKTEDFARDQAGLIPIRHEIWQGFVFVNFDADAPALGPQLATLTKIAAPYRFDRMKVVPVRRATVPWNWKVSLENFTEAYHQTFIHPTTADRDFPAVKAVYADSDGPWSYFTMPHVRGEKTPTIVPPVPDMPDQYYREFMVINVYPLLHIFADAATPLWLDWEIRGVGDHDMVWYMMVPEDQVNDGNVEELKRQFLGFIEPILLEDVDVCKSVGTGVQSAFARPGRLCWMEKSVHQFQNFLLDQYARD